ncbi:MAG: hypothetical protein DRH90_07835 [Deltaproteobacteria bacterium]|nr:MAG: hypothetical protein DRH90_07835 [Deltaproteobacteria bacterium]RLC13271.1 MAG: hypothetical protein DRI24_16065 [Deltaproteobacteria bacterium]
MFNVNYYIDQIMKIVSTRFGKVFFSILAGSIGAVILVLFLSGMTLSAGVGNILPVIIGFNTALTGYMVLEKTRDSFKYKRVISIGSGVAMVLATAAFLNIMYFRGAGVFLISMQELATLLFVGIVTSGLGGMLAIKYFNLKK